MLHAVKQKAHSCCVV